MMTSWDRCRTAKDCINNESTIPLERLDEKVNSTQEDDNSNTSFNFVFKMETNSPSGEVKTETNTQRPIIYTTRLEDMTIFLQDCVELSLKEINERIERESTPLFKNLNNQTTDVELQGLFYRNMLEKLKNYKLNVNSYVDNFNRADEYRVTVPGAKPLSEEKNKGKIDTSTREMNTATSATHIRKSNSKNYAENLNKTNNNVKVEYVTLISSDDDDTDSINLDKIRISNKNRSLLNLCKPVSIVLQDIGKTLTVHQTKKCNNPERITEQFIVPDREHLKIDKQLVQKRLIPIAPNLKSAILLNATNTVCALSPSHLQPIAFPTCINTDTTPLLSFKRYRHQQTKTLLLPPVGATWNPVGVYIVFRDLCTKDIEAHFLDGIGHPKEFYKLDFKSTKEIEKFIASQKFMTLACCCWYRREAYIQCMSPRFVPVQTAQLFKKPHKCPIYKCTCCCKGLLRVVSELNEASTSKLSVTEPQVGSLHSDIKEDVRKYTKEKRDYIQELLSNCNSTNSLIDRALRFDRNKQLNKVVQKPVAAETFQSRSSEIGSGLSIKNNCPKSTKVNVKYTINGSNEIYMQDSIEKVTLHTIGVPEHSLLKNDKGIENICCWYKLQSLCEKINLPLSFKSAKHSCPLENCCCCCYKPEIKIEKPRLVHAHLPTRVRHNMLNFSDLELTEIFQSVNTTGATTKTTENKTANETTNDSILAEILKTPKRTGVEKNVPSCSLKSIRSVQDYVDKVIVESLNSPNVKHGKPPKKLNSKNPPERANPKSLYPPPKALTKVSTSVKTPITAKLSEPCHTTYVSSTSTPIISEIYSGTSIQTDDSLCYPVITNVFSVAPQPTDVSKATTPVITGVFSNYSHTDTSLTPDLRASTSKGLPQTCTIIDSQGKIVESVISTVLETFKDVRLTINENGKVAASLNTPIHELNTTELKILGNILAHAQSEVESLASKPDSNVNNSINQLPFAAAMNTMTVPSSTNNTPITTSHLIQKTSSQSTQSFPILLIPVVPEPTTQTIYKTLSDEMGKKAEDYVKSYTSFTTLKTRTKHISSTLRNVGSKKRKMEHFVPIKPKIRVISPTKLGAPRSFMNESPKEDDKTGQTSSEPVPNHEDIESQLFCYSIPVLNRGTKNT
ncbi:uncharacterized protein LOC113230723 isoform X2 [Hyposmocoma kahamanoa]|uniref:uncharacterized protein LOC113230723 isoform X2 n=1 Tax=Hyposmocoma kahamanoa TaxID=1477025 RepID=UPI000E6D99F1|nr:uncharacterized protein LOC113230723 isoform X2 [Hyposmocoma kahamanoa]